MEVIFAIVILAVSVVNINGDCHLSFRDDFQRPAPVYIQNGGFLAPNKSGAISVRKASTMLVACTGTRRRVVIANDTTTEDVVEAHCIANTRFRVGQWVGPFREIKCNMQPWFSSELVKGGCGQRHQLHRVGYKVNGTFYPIYEACFDPDLLQTSYVRHELLPSTVYHQSTKARPSFSEGGLFGKVRMSKLYSLKNQEERINELLGPNAAEKYLTKKQYLSRGHLAARADFSMFASQVATFHYVNSAPQWFRGNAGDWAALEEGVRRRVHSLGRPVVMYTGTQGVMNFGPNKELFLTADANNNGIVPVPMYFYKLIYDPQTKKAAVFVLINSSYYNSTEIDQLTICEDVCQDKRYNWLSWRDDGTTSFCCRYEDAEELNLPKLRVSGLFY